MNKNKIENKYYFNNYNIKVKRERNSLKNEIEIELLKNEGLEKLKLQVNLKYNNIENIMQEINKNIDLNKNMKTEIKQYLIRQIRKTIVNNQEYFEEIPKGTIEYYIRKQISEIIDKKLKYLQQKKNKLNIDEQLEKQFLQKKKKKL